MPGAPGPAGLPGSVGVTGYPVSIKQQEVVKYNKMILLIQGPVGSRGLPGLMGTKGEEGTPGGQKVINVIHTLFK